MKKILLTVLICVLSLSCLYGCKQNNEGRKEEIVQNETSTFVKPKEYETVLTVSINPIFRLYLNSDNEVIAIEPVNKDAKSIVNQIDEKAKKLDEVVKNIVKCADENNFLKKDATVDVKIVETTSAQDKQTEILVIVKDTVKDNFDGVNVNTSVDVKDSKKDKNDKDNKKEEHNKTDKETTTDEKNSVDDKKENHTTQSNVPTHKHQYANATCTQPKKCSCGATEGKALGHTYANATCTKPKTCSCGVTSGNALGHSYDIDGVCTRCKTKDPNFKYPTLESMNGVWKSIHEADMADGKGLAELTYSFNSGEFGCGEWDYFLPKDLPEDYGELDEADCIVWDNEHYYRCGGGMVMEGTYNEEDDKIVLTDSYSNNGQLILQRISTNTMKVISVDSKIEYVQIPIGTILTFYED